MNEKKFGDFITVYYGDTCGITGTKIKRFAYVNCACTGSIETDKAKVFVSNMQDAINFCENYKGGK
jgi:hypothetical protein